MKKDYDVADNHYSEEHSERVKETGEVFTPEWLAIKMLDTLDVDWDNVELGDYLIIDCWQALDGNTYSGVWNDTFLKKYTTALMKKQWGQNLIKFQGVKLPGGIEFNGRQIYDDAQKELDDIRSQMSSTYELPPLDLIG